MNLRGITASLAALAVTVVLPIAIATPAQAGADPTIVHWSTTQTGPTSYTCTPSPSSGRANPGSLLTLYNDCQPGRLPFTVTFYIRQGNTLTQLGRATTGEHITFQVPATVGTYEVFISPTLSTYTLTVTNDFIPEPKAHDEFQQVGVPASDDCADVDPAVGHYPGYPIGGWSKSWAQWINDGTGGPVCTREVEQRPDGEIVLIG
jgi:hypothetical protein